MTVMDTVTIGVVLFVVGLFALEIRKQHKMDKSAKEDATELIGYESSPLDWRGLPIFREKCLHLGKDVALINMVNGGAVVDLNVFGPKLQKGEVFRLIQLDGTNTRFKVVAETVIGGVSQKVTCHMQLMA